MAISFDQFAAAIVQQESGGDYQARSPKGALGKYQILASNIPSWSKEILGYSISPQQFLASPALQDKIALGKLRQYYDAYGPAGAAAAWYSGDPSRVNDHSPVAGGPSVADYVASVLKEAAGKNWKDALGAVAHDLRHPSEIPGDVLGGVHNAAASVAESVVGSVWNKVGAKVLFVGLGLGLVGLGAYQTFKPQLREARQEAAQLVGAAARGAA